MSRAEFTCGDFEKYWAHLEKDNKFYQRMLCQIETAPVLLSPSQGECIQGLLRALEGELSRGNPVAASILIVAHYYAMSTMSSSKQADSKIFDSSKSVYARLISYFFIDRVPQDKVSREAFCSEMLTNIMRMIPQFFENIDTSFANTIQSQYVEESRSKIDIEKYIKRIRNKNFKELESIRSQLRDAYDAAQSYFYIGIKVFSLIEVCQSKLYRSFGCNDFLLFIEHSKKELLIDYSLISAKVTKELESPQNYKSAAVSYGAASHDANIIPHAFLFNILNVVDGEVFSKALTLYVEPFYYFLRSQKVDYIEFCTEEQLIDYANEFLYSDEFRAIEAPPGQLKRWGNKLNLTAQGGGASASLFKPVNEGRPLNPMSGGPGVHASSASAYSDLDVGEGSGGACKGGALSPVPESPEPQVSLDQVMSDADVSRIVEVMYQKNKDLFLYGKNTELCSMVKDVLCRSPDLWDQYNDAADLVLAGFGEKLGALPGSSESSANGLILKIAQLWSQQYPDVEGLSDKVERELKISLQVESLDAVHADVLCNYLSSKELKNAILSPSQLEESSDEGELSGSGDLSDFDFDGDVPEVNVPEVNVGGGSLSPEF